MQYTGAANVNGNDATTITASASGGNGGALASNPVVNVDITPVQDPATGAREITGTTVRGSVLTANPGAVLDVHGFHSDAVSWQWLRGGHDVSRAAGYDLIRGFAGDDYLSGRAGDDLLHGGNGTDMLHGGAAASMLRGGTARDTLRGDAGVDLLFGEHSNDVLTGGIVADLLSASNGNDRLVGGGGAHTLNGGAGAEVLIGGSGDDVLAGWSPPHGAAVSGQREFRCSLVLKRQLSWPVSMMSHRWVRRSSSAVVVLASPRTDGASPKSRLAVTITDVRSQRQLARWNSNWPPVWANGR